MGSQAIAAVLVIEAIGILAIYAVAGNWLLMLACCIAQFGAMLVMAGDYVNEWGPVADILTRDSKK